MTKIEWECFEDFINEGYFKVIDAGTLISPIQKVTVQRNSKLHIEVITISNNSNPITKNPVVGKIQEITEEVQLINPGGINVKLKGVSPKNYKSHLHHTNKTTTQLSSVGSIEATLKDESKGKYLIEWLYNVDTGNLVFPHNISKLNSNRTEIIIGKKKKILAKLQSTTGQEKHAYNCVCLNINSTELYLCKSFDDACNLNLMPGFILYKGVPTKEERKKIRDCLSFSLGKFLVYIGHTVFCDNWKMVSFEAISPYTFKKAVFDLPAMPPAPIFDGNFLNKDALLKLVNAVYSCYEQYDLKHIFKQYWHASCSPFDIAGVHFGASFEALQRACLEESVEKIINDENKWGDIKKVLNDALSGIELEGKIKSKFVSKINNLNRLSSKKEFRESFIKKLSIEFSSAEKQAWYERNRPAHGEKIKDDAYIKAIKQIKLLKIRMHRAILALSQGSDYYIDYYTEGNQFISRDLKIGVPTQNNCD
jgi:hypothetical protein